MKVITIFEAHAIYYHSISNSIFFLLRKSEILSMTQDLITYWVLKSQSLILTPRFEV